MVLCIRQGVPGIGILRVAANGLLGGSEESLPNPTLAAGLLIGRVRDLLDRAGKRRRTSTAA
jgi:hypothetical protein